MDSLLSALGLVCLAELGDKTQLVALGLGARHRLRPVLLGVAIAYALSNLLAVVVGGLLGSALPARGLGLGGGVLFLAFAAWNLVGDDSGGLGAHSTGDAVASGPVGGRIVWSTIAAMFVAELGDKTQLATTTLATQSHPLIVWVGATLGIMLAGFVGVGVGRATGTRLPDRLIRIGSSILFAVFGLVLISTNL